MEIKIQILQFLHLAAAGAAERYFSIPSAFPFEFQLFHDPKSALNYKQLYFLLKYQTILVFKVLDKVKSYGPDPLLGPLFGGNPFHSSILVA